MFSDAPLDSGTATVEAGCCACFGSDGHGGLTEDLPTERFVAGRTTLLCRFGELDPLSL